MNRSRPKKHSVDSLFSILLFAIFVVILLLLLLFSARMYQISVANLEQNQNLHTAMTYVATKFRQHDQPESISLREINGIPGLCFTDTIDDVTYDTCLYLYQGELKELFAADIDTLSPEVGATLASLSAFTVTEEAGGLYRIRMEDPEGVQAELLMHPGSPVTDLEEAS